MFSDPTSDFSIDALMDFERITEGITDRKNYDKNDITGYSTHTYVTQQHLVTKIRKIKNIESLWIIKAINERKDNANYGLRINIISN